MDDDPLKHGMWLSNLLVFGALADILKVVEQLHVQDLLIAMPKAPGTVVRDVVQAAYDAGIRTRTVPGLFEIIGERVNVTAIRENVVEAGHTRERRRGGHKQRPGYAQCR